jgi:hypothetical protein
MRKRFILCAAFASFVATAAGALNTYKSWDGETTVYYFGCPGATTYGQVITIPKGKTRLNNFAFWWQNFDGFRGSMVVRGEVYAWNGTRAEGSALYESTPRTFSFNDDAFHKEVFETAGIPVTPDAQYVIFTSVDKDFGKCTYNDRLALAFMQSDVYSKGLFVYQWNHGRERRWTTRPWLSIGGDAAFTANFSP